MVKSTSAFGGAVIGGIGGAVTWRPENTVVTPSAAVFKRGSPHCSVIPIFHEDITRETVGAQGRATSLRPAGAGATAAEAKAMTIMESKAKRERVAEAVKLEPKHYRGNY